MKQPPYILVVNSRVVSRPVFVVGAPHSGTDLVARALSRSPGLYLTAGLPVVLQATYALARRPSIAQGKPAGTVAMLREAFAEAWQLTGGTCPECSTGATDESEAASGDRTAPCRHGRGMERFGDASPDLLYSAAALADAFPDALFVQVIRDGRDVVADMLADEHTLAWFRPEMLNAAADVPNPFFGIESEEERRAYGELPASAKCALRWRGAVHLSARLRQKMSAERLLTLRYEEIGGGEVEAAERLTAFIGRTVSAVELVSSSPNGIGTWRRKLNQEQLAHIHKAAEPELTRLGYL